jgi:hypothetical protein
MSRLYFVESYGENAITLRQFMFRFVKVTIPRAQIASLQTTLGDLYVIETTGHRQYKVGRGFTLGQRMHTENAFASPVGMAPPKVGA